jgi:hypothetical protein
MQFRPDIAENGREGETRCPARIGIEGGSIGSEMALMVAAHYPQIKVVVATMPTGIVWPGISPTTGNPPSTFTLGGKPLPDLPYGMPFTSVYDLYAKGLLALDKHQDAVIPVEQINGPVTLVATSPRGFMNSLLG